MFRYDFFNGLPFRRLQGWLMVRALVLCAFVIGILALQGCSIKEKLYGRVSSTNYINTDADVPEVVNGVYSIYQTYGLYKYCAHTMMLYSSDEFCPPNISGTYFVYTETSADPYMSQVWPALNSTIEQANATMVAVNNAPLVTAATKKKVIGEMYFVRDFSYFDLVRLYGGVPVRLSPTTDPASFNLPRQSVDSVYHQLLNDLDSANDMCVPYSLQPKAEWGRATKGAAQAIKALACLTYGNYLDLNNRSGESPYYYTLANSFADSVILSNQYTLLTNYASLFDVSNERNAYNEVIFGIQQTRDATIAASNSKGSVMAFSTNSAELPNICGNPPLGYAQGSLRVQPWFYNLYVSGDYKDSINKANDYRTDFTFLTNWYRNDGINPVTHYVTYPIVVPDSARLTREQLPYFNKYHDPLGYDGSNNENDEYIIRLAEVYLIKAEALNELGQTGSATNAFNKVRARARLANGTPRKAPFDLRSGLSKYDFRMAVYNERGIELTGEFGRWFDDVRMQYQNSGKCMLQWRFDTFYPSLAASSLKVMPQWDTKTKKWNPMVNGVPQGGVVQPLSVPAWKEKSKLFPIPASELAANGNLGGQNPGW